MAIRILLVDDHNILREGVRALLEKQQGFEVVAEADNGREAIDLARSLNPRVVIMDINMPDMNGIEATRRISAQADDIHIIILSMYTSRRTIREVFKAGAAGFIVKGSSSDELFSAIKAVISGDNYLSPVITGVVLSELNEYMSSDENEVDESGELTKREREVLQLIAEGLTSKDIAVRLNMSVRTEHAHRHRIMKKLNLHNVAELTRYAIREGISYLD